ncbi:hypothetical protein B1M34_24435, partial [Salmonella enterica subsp. enterica serovar Dublin]
PSSFPRPHPPPPGRPRPLRGWGVGLCPHPTPTNLLPSAAAASVHGLAPLHLPRRPTRPVSYYAFFK